MPKKYNILSESPIHYSVAFLDYLYVITVYSIIAFFCSIIIDGYIIPEFNLQIALKRSSIFLAAQILLQLAIQGFIAIFLYALLQKIYSPFNGLYGYTSDTPLGLTIRSPAIISVLLFFFSISLHNKLMILFNRFSNKPQTDGLNASNSSSNTTTKDNKNSQVNDVNTNHN
jgi:hypothetical protein